MLPQEAFDRSAQRLGRVIGMDVDEEGQPKNYVILLEGDAAKNVLGGGASRGLLVVPATDAEVRARNESEEVLLLKNNFGKLKKSWAGGPSPADDEDPAAW